MKTMARILSGPLALSSWLFTLDLLVHHTWCGEGWMLLGTLAGFACCLAVLVKEGDGRRN